MNRLKAKVFHVNPPWRIGPRFEVEKRPGSLVRLPSVDAGVSLMDRNAFDVVSGICGGHIDHVELRTVRRHLDV